MKTHYPRVLVFFSLLIITVGSAQAAGNAAQSKTKDKAKCNSAVTNANKASGAGGQNKAGGVVKEVPNTPPPCTDSPEPLDIQIDGQAYYCNVINGTRRCYKY